MKDSDWAQFAKDQAAKAPGVRLFAQAPAGLEVDKVCPDCGRGDFWRVVQVLGETPGRTDTVNGKLVPIRASRGGLKMNCRLCGATYTYRDVEFTDVEQSHRTAKLLEQGKKGGIL